MNWTPQQFITLTFTGVIIFSGSIQAVMSHPAKSAANQIQLADSAGDVINSIRVSNESPSPVRGLINQGQVLSSQGKYPEAEDMLKKALNTLDKTPGEYLLDRAHCLNNLGLVYQQQEKFPQAQELYKQSIDISEKKCAPDDPLLGITLDNLAQTYRFQGKYDEAEPLYKRALNAEENSAGAGSEDAGITQLNLYLLYAEQKKYAEAEPMLRYALNIFEVSRGATDSIYLQYMQSYADLLKKMGREADAKKIAGRIKAIQNNGGSPDTKWYADAEKAFLKARDLIKQGKIEESMPYFDESIRLDPDRTWTYFTRSIVYQGLSENQKALADDSSAIKLNPKFPGPYLDRGNINLSLGHMEEAIQDFNEAIKLNPKDPDFYVSRAVVYEKLGKSDLANKDKEKALELGYKPDRTEK